MAQLRVVTAQVSARPSSRRKLTLLSLTAVTSAVPLLTSPCVASFRVQHTRSPLRSSMVSTP